jgi:superfamily I DNA and/or RNA helicase
VLSPYRAQRSLIKSTLATKNNWNVAVNTVHTAQGNERSMIIFDVVMANSKFFRNKNLGSRLVNVAFSRAMSRAVFIISTADLDNFVVKSVADEINAVREYVNDR